MGDIASIRANQNATFSAEITAISPPREVTTSRGTSSVADATLKDATGTTTLTLWGEDITKYKVGSKIEITDGWVKDFKGKLQVSLGRSGEDRRSFRSRTDRPAGAGRTPGALLANRRVRTTGPSGYPYPRNTSWETRSAGTPRSARRRKDSCTIAPVPHT